MQLRDIEGNLTEGTPTLRFLVYCALRHEQWGELLGCAGEKSCPDAIEIRDSAGGLMSRERCPQCRVSRYREAMRGSIGHLIDRAADLDRSLEWGLRCDDDAVDCREWAALKILREEQSRFRAEQSKSKDDGD